MAPDADHPGPTHTDRRTTIARPVAGTSLSDIETLQRAARHIRLRSHERLDMLDMFDEPGLIAAAGRSSTGGTVLPAGDADS